MPDHRKKATLPLAGLGRQARQGLGEGPPATHQRRVPPLTRSPHKTFHCTPPNPLFLPNAPHPPHPHPGRNHRPCLTPAHASPVPPYLTHADFAPIQLSGIKARLTPFVTVPPESALAPTARINYATPLQ